MACHPLHQCQQRPRVPDITKRGGPILLPGPLSTIHVFVSVIRNPMSWIRTCPASRRPFAGETTRDHAHWPPACHVTEMWVIARLKARAADRNLESRSEHALVQRLGSLGGSSRKKL
jgi:hypothetical protein